MSKLIETDQATWISMAVPDVYFSFEYHNASMLLEPSAVRVSLLEWKCPSGIIRLPLIIRRIEGTDYFDATSAYGYGGPWSEGTPQYAEFSAAFNDWANENRIVCTFLRYHPLLKNADEFHTHLSSINLGPTAAWDLQSSNDLLETLSKGHRKSYRRAIRAGVEAQIAQNPKRMDNFKNLYETSMNRLSASEFYHFPETYWESMVEGLGDQSLLVEAEYQGKTIAAAWCLATEKYLHFHLSGTTDEGRQLGGAFVCRVAAAQWARERGLAFAHFGGGLGGTESTLLTWKRKFDENLPLLQFSIGKIVHSEEKFSFLASKYPETNFFPPWRAGEI